MANAANIPNFSNHAARKFPLHVERVLHGNRRAAVVRVGERVRRCHASGATGNAGQRVSPSQIRSQGVSIRAEPTSQIARHVESRIASVLAVENTSTSADHCL